jgi:hypothetical protein
MKTSVEINGYTISIEESEGVISVNAVKDDEVVEEFTIQIEEEGDEDHSEFDSEDSDIRKFGELGEEEEDFGGSEEFESEDEEGHEEEGQDDDEFETEDDDDDDEVAPEGTLESFQSFINKKRK